VTIDGVVARELGVRADFAVNEIRVDGKLVRPVEKLHYLAINKPEGYLSTREDTHERRTIMDLIPPELHQIVYPVGRLDLESSGLLLLTNDGALAHRLIHPRYHVAKTYVVTVQGEPDLLTLRRLRIGVEIETGVTSPAQVRVLGQQGSRTVLEFVLREGKKRQIRRMCEVVGHHVTSLKRVQFGPISLGDIALGECRELSAAEVEALKAAAGGDEEP
jgi:pseudouridine synthase